MSSTSMRLILSAVVEFVDSVGCMYGFIFFGLAAVRHHLGLCKSSFATHEAAKTVQTRVGDNLALRILMTARAEDKAPRDSIIVNSVIVCNVNNTVHSIYLVNLKDIGTALA